MKNAVIGFCSIIILLLAGMGISTAEGRTMRQNELDSTLNAAMVQSMEVLTMSKDYSVTFQKDGKVIKQIQVHGGDFLSGSLLPQGVGVTKWKDKASGTVYTASNIANLAVTKDLTLEAA